MVNNDTVTSTNNIHSIPCEDHSLTDSKKTKMSAKKTTKTNTSKVSNRVTKNTSKMTNNECKCAEIVLQINNTEYTMQDIENLVYAAILYTPDDSRKIRIYINASEQRAYYTIDGIGNSQYFIQL